jgi:hypothetical protein
MEPQVSDHSPEAGAILPRMSRPAVLRLVLVLASVAMAGAHARGIFDDPVVVLMLDEPAPAPPPNDDVVLERLFATRMTPDDVARGVWALAQGQGPGLAEGQGAALLPTARRARDARHQVDGLRSRRRAERAALRESGLALAVALATSDRLPHFGTQPSLDTRTGAPRRTP